MATTHDAEKGHVSLEHEEHGHVHSSKDEGLEDAVDDVASGMNGISSWVKSPFVFGAALLASMGGFSYGYGGIPV